MKGQKKKQSGITLIALVISIIVMLILAGVSLNATIGNNGIVTKAKQASMMSAIAAIQEEIEMYRVSKVIDGYEGLDIYPIAKDGSNRITMTTKLKSGELKLSDLTSNFKHYLIKKVGQSDANIIPDINNLDLYNSFYYIDEEAIPSSKSFLGTLVMFINNSGYDLISFEGIDWDGTGNISYGASTTNHSTAQEELANQASYYSVANNTYKLYATGEVKVLGELTEKIANLTPELTSKNEGRAVNKIDFIGICNKYSIGTTTTNPGNYDTIGKNSTGTTYYVPKLIVIGNNKGQSVYILDTNNNLWVWGDATDNKFCLGVTGFIEKPTKILENVKNVWANNYNTVVLTTGNKIYMAGNNTKGLLGQGDEQSYSTWVEPTYVTNYNEIYVAKTQNESELEYATLTGNANGSTLKDVALNNGISNGENTIFLVYENGDVYFVGYNGAGIGNYTNSTKRYVNITSFWNDRLAELYPIEGYTTLNIKKVLSVYSNIYLVMQNNDFLSAGWVVGSCRGGNGTTSVFGRPIDTNDEECSTEFVDLGARDCLVTQDGLYYMRVTTQTEEGIVVSYLYKAFKIEDLPVESYDYTKSFTLGQEIFVINGKIYPYKWNGYTFNVEFEPIDELNDYNVIYNKAVLNFGTIDCMVFYADDGNYYSYNCDKVRLSEDKNLYRLYDTDISGVTFAADNGEEIDMLLDNGNYIEGLNKDTAYSISSENSFISKILSTPMMKAVIYNNSEGEKNILLKGRKYLGCWGLSSSNSSTAVTGLSNYPSLNIEDKTVFENLKSDSSNNFEDVKNIFTTNKNRTTDFSNLISGSFVTTNAGKLYMFGFIKNMYLAPVSVPGMQVTNDELNYFCIPESPAYNRSNTSYPIEVKTDVIEEIGESIADIAFSINIIEGGIDVRNTSILTDDGDLYVYGNHIDANGTATSLNDFTKLELGAKVKKIYSAYGLSFAITTKGDVYVWGLDTYNISGFNSTFIPTPRKIPISNVYYISIGQGYAIYACEDGKVYGIGQNTFGQLGTGDNISTTTFVECVELEK